MFTGPLIACGCDDTKIRLYSMDGEKVIEHTYCNFKFVDTFLMKSNPQCYNLF